MPSNKGTLRDRNPLFRRTGGTGSISDTRQQDSIESETVEQPRSKAMFYITADDDLAIEELRIAHQKSTGKRVDRSAIVRQAIQKLYAEQKGAQQQS